MTSPAIEPSRADDVRYFRNRAREERRRVRHATTDRARRIHGEMAEHYEAVAVLLDAHAAHEPRSLASALRAMLQRMVQG